MKSIARSLLVVYLLPVLLAAACTPASSPQDAMTAETQTAATDSGSVEIASADLTGASLYKFACAACHGQKHAGSTFEVAGQTIKVPALDWADLNILYTADRSRGTIPEQVALAITKGQDPGGGEMNPMMPRWSTLSSQQIESLIQYIEAADTTETTRPSPEPAATNLMGEQLFLTSCAACHGMDGAGKTFEKDGNTIRTPSLHWNELRNTFSRDPNRGTPPEQVALAITTGKDETGAELNTMMPRWSFFSQAQAESLVQYLQTAFK
jgi:mono/diheme cytochrome c family protein